MRILVCPQEFKGTLTAREAAEAMAEGVRRVLPDAEVSELPLSDGGPGLQEALLAARGGRVLETRVLDALGREVDARWAQLDGGTAVIEMAAAAGLWRLREDERDPMRATTYGVGQLLGAALEAKAHTIIVGLGGSATNDGGAGMAAALGAQLLNKEGRELERGAAALARLDRIDAGGLDARLRDTEVIAVADVRNPLLGPEGASTVYGPQKGASADQVEQLEAALRLYAQVVERDTGVAVSEVEGTGAAGGLGAGLVAFCGASIRPGFEVVAETASVSEWLAAADVVVTGEGRLDGQTVFGKTVAGVARMAAELGVPVIVVPGSLGKGWEAILPLVFGVEPVVGAGGTAEDALARPSAMLSLATARALSGWRGIEDMRRG